MNGKPAWEQTQEPTTIERESSLSNPTTLKARQIARCWWLNQKNQQALGFPYLDGQKSRVSSGRNNDAGRRLFFKSVFVCSVLGIFIKANVSESDFQISSLKERKVDKFHALLIRGAATSPRRTTWIKINDTRFFKAAWRLGLFGLKPLCRPSK